MMDLQERADVIAEAGEHVADGAVTRIDSADFALLGSAATASATHTRARQLGRAVHRAAELDTMCFHVLGELEVGRGASRSELPQSKKTRALLAYLVLTGRSHRRETLSRMFWDVTDDPRGALRWSLSKLRALVDDEHAKRIVADRDHVRFDACGARVDLLEVRAAIGIRGVPGLSTEELERLAGAFRGELLEGLELADFHEYQAWWVAEREHARALRSALLTELLGRLHGEPERALEVARALVQSNPASARGRAALVSVLGELGRREEALQHYEIGRRLELGGRATDELEVAWRAVAGRGGARAESKTPPPAPRIADDHASGTARRQPMRKHKVYDSRSPSIEASGAVFIGYLNALGVYRALAIDGLSRRGIHEPESHAWYPRQIMLDILRELEQHGGRAILFRAGKAMADVTQLPPEMSSFETVLEASSQIYAAYNRNLPADDFIRVERTPAGFRYIYQTPWPTPAIKGWLTQTFRKFHPLKALSIALVEGQDDDYARSFLLTW